MSVLARHCLVIGVACSAPATGRAQETRVERIRAITVDANRDLVPDRLGERVALEGPVTVGPYQAALGSETRLYVQDDSGGIRCVASRPAKFAGISIGDRVRVAGELRQFHGMDYLAVQRIERLDPGPVPAPRDVSVADLFSEANAGAFVRVNARLRVPTAVRRIFLVDDTGEVRLYAPKDFFRDRTFAELARDGAYVTAVGIAEQWDSAPPYDGGYRLRLASVRHLARASGPFPTLLALGIAAGLLLASGGWIVLRRRTVAGRGRAVTRLDAQQARKMEALGTLAGGIAHDFNNYLLAIVGLSELARDRLPPDSPVLDNLERILLTCDRAKRLVENILLYSRDSGHRLEVLDAAEVITASVELLRAALPTSIEFREQIDGDVGHIRGDVGELSQLVLNLGKNAADAMENGGTMTISLRRGPPSDTGMPAPEECVLLTVGDSGVGMDQATLERIFDPFFTTKPTGDGTGLGLSVVHGILHRHDATMRAQSRRGHGTTIEVEFPLVEPEPQPARASEQGSHTGTERILLIDDEHTIATLGQSQLQELGYDVTVETDPVEALRVFREAPGGFDAVVTDYRMPRLSGVELAQQVRAMKARVPILLTTGFSDEATQQGTAAREIDEIVLKPYRRSDLATALRRVLDGATSSA